MAGRSNKGRNKKASQNSTSSAAGQVASSDVAQKITVEPPKVESNGVSEEPHIAVTEEASEKSSNAVIEVALENTSEPSHDQAKHVEGEAHLYPVAVKAPSGEKLELRLSPGDSVLDLRQFLVDAPETCFFTCYDLILHTKDGAIHYLEDHNEISEVGDITTGGCSLEMVDALYDDRSIRAHVHRARELLSLSSLHASLSTSLALQQEKMQKTTADAEKVEVPELDGLGFMENITGSLSNLVSSSSKNIKCVESIVFSSFNPPPSYRRLVGDLIYIDVATLEGRNLCITGTTNSFYVNSSSGNTLDPKPAKLAAEATTLIGLLLKISGKFKKAFREILDLKASAHPFESVQTPLPPNSWLGAYPVSDHKRDAARAESSLTLSFGSELVGMQRDWNEELQSCREFPQKHSQERILRGRALYKVTSDFVDAAINGAVGVINRCIPPINPTDPECFHMYVHNNIFFSFAVDADLGQLTRNHVSNVELKPDNTDSAQDTSEKANKKLSSGIIGETNLENAAVNNVTDVSPDVATETELTDSDQATYASANNDLKGTKAYQEADIPGLYNLAMAIIDYRGYRLVAQSIIPGILQGDKSDSLLYGSVDNGKKICWNEAFHSKVLEAAKRLHVKEHIVLDGSGNVVKLAAPVECKGIVGADERHYLLDLNRITPRDVNYTGPGTRNFVLRHELVSAFCKAEAEERLKCRSKTDGDVPVVTESSDAAIQELTSSTSDTQIREPTEAEAVHECDTASAENSANSDEIVLNPNVFTEFKLGGSEEDVAADEEGVRKASLYLKDTVLPRFVQDLCTLEVSPMDGQTLTEALHAHGINVRYIGKVADMTKHLPHVWDLCVTEIVVRSAKHIFKEVLRESQDHDLALAVSHFFNCFFGRGQAIAIKSTATQSRPHKKDRARHQASGNSSHGQARWKKEGSFRKNPSFMHITSESLWSDIQEFAKFKYQFDLPEDASLLVKKVSAIRNLCQKVGITIAARKYDFEAASPFQMSDILNLQPVVKHSVPLCSEAKDLVETGKVQLAEGMLNEAYTLFSEAFSILQQVTGPMHREVANCCRYLAMVLYHAGDMAGAITHQHKELIINERCLGLDHPDTAHSYGNMALFYHGLNQPELALRHMSRTMLLLGLSCGPDHPDVAATFINVAMMYQDIGKMNIALRYLQEALKRNERLLGVEHIQTAVCYHALAIAFNCMGAFKLSLQHETKTYDILVKQLGEEDSRTRDSQNWINTFKMRELQVSAQKMKGQDKNAASTQKAIDILKAHPDLIQAFQAAAAAGGSGNVDASVNKSLSAAMIGETLPRGRGVDERAVRAAAEVRKKAAARGLLVRPHSVPIQPFPLTQLLNIIKSGDLNEDHTHKDEPNKEVDGPVVNDTKENGSVTGQVDKAPVGLGTGLATLETKKQKKKQKGAAGNV